jgi:heterodisulfide reductase subunit B
MKIGYFPGCSLHATAREYEESLRAITSPLGLELCEIEDWACCGASSAHAVNHLLSLALPARTLALAEEQGFERVLAPCAACYSRLARTRHELLQDKKLTAQVVDILRRPLSLRVQIISIAEFFREMIPVLKEKLTTPLPSTKVACYYGCLLVRPREVATFDDAEAPSSMEAVIAALGAQPVSWNRRVDCCGAGFSLSRTGAVLRLGTRILEDAKAAGADVIAVGCPMCHSNLDFRQKAMSQKRSHPFDLPILFLPQLIGLSLGLEPQTLGLKRHFITTAPFLERLGPSKQLPAKTDGGPPPRQEEVL